MAFYEQKIRALWTAHHRYLVKRRRLFGPDEQPVNDPEEHERRIQSLTDGYDAELRTLHGGALRDAERINEEYEAEPSREHAWVRSRAALEFVHIINGARERLRNPDDGGAT